MVSRGGEQAPVIEALSLFKRFGELTAVDGVSFAVPPGVCYGLLGPNGAGKTSTVRMIQAVSPPTSGTIHVLGLNVARHPRRVKAGIGVCPQEDNLDPDFSVWQNLIVHARYFGLGRREAAGRAGELLDFLQLSDRKATAIRDLSGGMKRRLVLARSLINSPRLLLLDEPTTGLDPQGRHTIWQRLRALRAAGTTILLTTHYMEEAARLCDWVVIMDHGKIIAEGHPARLVAEHVSREVLEVWGGGPEVQEFAGENGWRFETLQDRLCIYTDSGEEDYGELTSRFEIDQCVLRHGNLEDVFLKLTGRELRE